MPREPMMDFKEKNVIRVPRIDSKRRDVPRVLGMHPKE